MDDSIKRWTAKRKTALVIEIIQGKTTVAEASDNWPLTSKRYDYLIVLIFVGRCPPTPPISLYNPISPPITAHHHAI